MCGTQALLSGLAIMLPEDPIEYIICMIETGIYDNQAISTSGKRVIKDLKWLLRCMDCDVLYDRIVDYVVNTM